MNFYSYDDIKAACPCDHFATVHLGLKLANGRCAATWRGGDNPTSVAINTDGWFDHKTHEKGSVIDLVAKVRGINIFQAQEFCGQVLGLTPRTALVSRLPGEAPRNRYERLLDQGYHEAARYPYTDADGKLVHQVIRLEHPAPTEGQNRKEFVQADPRGTPSVKGIELVLYNLPAVADSDWAIIVEGEKDVETLKAWELPATCNAGGAEKWLPQYTAALAGKSIIILPDNDEPGQAHAQLVAGHLKAVCPSIRVLTVSGLPKGDVTDWRDKEGGTLEELGRLMAAAPDLDLASIPEPDPEQADLKKAKEANRYPFSNYFLLDEPTADGKVKKIQKPRKPQAMLDDLAVRFLGFPRRVGGTMFDHDRDSGEIVQFRKVPGLFSWIQRKSKNPVDWARGNDFPTKDEFFESVLADAQAYEGISHVPDWPRRPDVFYTHGVLPPPTPNHEAFNGLLQFFNPAPEYIPFLRAFIAAPLYYEYGIPRPLWIIDSEDGQSTGKTTLVEMVAYLYGRDPIAVAQTEMLYQAPEVIKRLVTTDGRMARIFLLDNVTGDFRSRELSGMITRHAISARPPYGHTEETRPNNLTYTITCNSGTVDSDLATRAYYIFVRRGTLSATWKSDLQAYITQHRMQIFADIISILEGRDPEAFEGIQPSTRFPEFERLILQPMAGSFDAYADAVKVLADAKTSSNVDDDSAYMIEDIIRAELVELGIHPDQNTVFIQSNAVEAWLADGMPEATFETTNALQLVRNLSKTGMLPRVDKRKKRMISGGRKMSGILWLAEGAKYHGAGTHFDTINHVVVRQGKKTTVLPGYFSHDEKF